MKKAINESQLRQIVAESVKRILKEMNEDHASYADWESFLGGKEPIFDFRDGNVYIDYDEATGCGCLCSGYVTNNGFHKDGECEVPVENGDFQSALEEIYGELLSNHQEYDDTEY